MGLLNDLQKGNLPGPTSRKFDLHGWQAMSENNKLDDDELALIDTGIFIHNTLNKLRARLKFTARKDLPSAFKKVGILYLVNRDCLQAELELRERSLALTNAHGLLPMDALSSHKLSLSAGMFSPDDIAETANDTGEALIKLMSEDDSCATDPTNFEVDELVNELRIAFAYRATEDLWTDVVWRSYRMTKSGQGVVFVSGDLEGEALRTKSLYRHMMQMSQAVTFGIARSLERPAPMGESLEQEFATFCYARKVTRTVGTAPYYLSKANEPGPQFPNLTLRMVTAAFDVVSTEAERNCSKILSNLKRIEKGAAEFGVIKPTEYACVLDRIRLIALIVIETQAPPHLAAEALDFLTLRAKQPADAIKSEIWSAPCIRLDDRYVGIAEHPLRCGNVLRLTDIWFRRLGFDLDFRGSGFENHARAALKEACQRSSLAAGATVFSRELTFTDITERREEIDLLIVIGRHLIVGEIKCFLAPTTPLDWANHQVKIIDAAAQVSRKTIAIERSPTQFRTRAEQLGLTLPRDFVLVPVVVLNHAIGAGQVVDEVPIVDLRILEMYFEGELASFGIINPDGEIERGPPMIFYETPGQAGDRIASYLRRPPQLSHLKDSIRSRSFAIQADKGERLYTIERLDVDGEAVFEALQTR